MSTRVIIAVASFTLCFVVMLYSGSVQATGVGVSPHRLEVEVNLSGVVSSSISVVNTSDEESLYQVYIEGEDLRSWFYISPWEFVLEPESCQEVQIDISPPAMASGEYETNVCVVGLIHASELKVGCGVKVPVRIKITAPLLFSVMGINVTKPCLLAAATGVVAGVVAGAVAWRKRKRRAYES